MGITSGMGSGLAGRNHCTKIGGWGSRQNRQPIPIEAGNPFTNYKVTDHNRRQMVNHLENHRLLTEKYNLLLNLTKYCDS